MTDLADEITDGTRRVILKQVKRTAEKKGNSSKARKSDILNSRGLELFEQLRQLRTKIAGEEGLPPYIIFSDKTLVDMCIKVPVSKEEMLRVSGVGENKQYGERFM